jgi:glycosyltransferase involved in cell wall biosynthesis
MGANPKIGYVLKRFPRLSETFVLNEILELERQGAEVQVYSLVDVDELPEEGAPHALFQELRSPIAYLPARQPLKKWAVKMRQADSTELVTRTLKDLCGGDVPQDSILRLLAALLGSLAKVQGVGHLHAHFASQAAELAMLAGRLTGIPFSFTAHAKDIYDHSVDSALLRQKLHEARFVVTVSEYNRLHLATLAGEPAGRKILRLYNGIDLQRFQPGPASLRDPELILAIGRLEEKKGFHHLIAACAMLRKSGHRFRCLIAGQGREHDALAETIKRLDLQGEVSLVGAQPQELLIETLKRAAILVLPCVVSSTGDRDGLPTVLLEAMAMGLPVVSTHLAGIPEIVQDGKTGLLVSPGEPAQLAQAISELLRQPELRESFGRAGRARAEKLFDLHKNVVTLHEQFKRSLTGEEIARPALEGAL